MRLFNLDEVECRHAGIALFLRCEAIWNTLYEMVGTEFFGIDIHISEDAVRAKVVESTHVVIVFVSDENSVKRLEIHAQHLLAEIRTAVDEKVLPSHFDKGRTAQPLVPWVGRGASLAGAANLWHSA